MTELEFYSKFARPLILSLPDQKDRILAATWLRKIQDENSGPVELRTDYLKLLLFALQRQKLVGIFEDDPTSYEELGDFSDQYDLNSLARALIEKEHKDRQDRIRAQLKGEIGDFPPYSTDYSPDLKEYVAAQDIPGFGVHCFYAVSKEPISNWRKVEKVVIPKVAKSAVDTMSPVPHGVSKNDSDSACICAPKEDPAADPSECRTRNKPPATQRKKKSKKLGQSPPTHPLGKAPPPEDRQVPQWGSNLTEIKNLIQFEDEGIETAPKKSTGAIPKVKGKSVKIIYDDDSSVQEIDQALRDFRKGDISSIHRRKGKSPTRQQQEPAQPQDVGSPYQGVAGSLLPRDEYEEWRNENLDRSIWQEEVDQDADLLDYFKRQLSSRDAKQHLARLHSRSHTSEPAKAGLPVTTPKLSPSPKRVMSSEKLIAEDQLKPLKRPCKTEDQIDPRKDQELSRLHEELLAGIAEDEERLRREQEELERREMEEREAMRRAQEETKRIHGGRKLKQKKEPTHIQPGSPEANTIFADYLSGLTEATKEEDSEGDEGGPAIFEARPLDSSFEGDAYETTPPSARLVVREPKPSELMRMMPGHVADDKYIEKTISGEESQRFAKRVSAITETPKHGRLPQTDEAMEKKKRRRRTTEETRKRRLDFDELYEPEVNVMDQPVPAYLEEPMRYAPGYAGSPPAASPECQCYQSPLEQDDYHTPQRTQRKLGPLGPPGSYETPDSFEREDIEDERYMEEMRERLEDMEIRDFRTRWTRVVPFMPPIEEQLASPDSPADRYCGSPGYSDVDDVEGVYVEEAGLSPDQEHLGSPRDWEDYSAEGAEACECSDDYYQYSDEEYPSSPPSPSRVLNRTYTKRKFVTDNQ